MGMRMTATNVVCQEGQDDNEHADLFLLTTSSKLTSGLLSLHQLQAGQAWILLMHVQTDMVACKDCPDWWSLSNSHVLWTQFKTFCRAFPVQA